jgi:hypothetical protein
MVLTPARSRATPWQPLGEQLAAGLIVCTAAAMALGRAAPESMGMTPLMGALVLLLLGNLRREPLTGGCLVLLMLSLRDLLKGDGRYGPEELTLTDVLLVMIAFAATVLASRGFWHTFQGLFAAVLPAVGAVAWKLQPGTVDQPFPAGSLTAPQSTVVFGLCLCYATVQLNNSLGRAHRALGLRWILASLLWSVCAILAGRLVVASGGPPSLLLVGMALLLAKLSRWIRRRPHQSLWAAGLLAALLLSATGAAVFLGPPSLIGGHVAVRERLSLLGCFFHAPFRKVEWFVHGVGFTNSSTWLCETVRSGERMIQADNVLAQLAADTGMLTVLVLSCLLLWMVRRIWLLSGPQADPVVEASLGGALYLLLVGQTANGWGQSTLIQVLLGLQLAALGLRIPQQNVAP